MTGPYALLAKGIGLILVLGGAMWWASHRQSQIDASAIATLKATYAQAILNEQAKAHGAEITAESSEAHTRDEYETKLQSQLTAQQLALDTMRRLRDSPTVNTGCPGVPTAAGVPVPDAANPLGTAFTTMADFGRRAAIAADACEARLTACEQWAITLQKEYQ